MEASYTAEADGNRIQINHEDGTDTIYLGSDNRWYMEREVPESRFWCPEKLSTTLGSSSA